MHIEAPAHNIADRIAFAVGMPVLSGVIVLFAWMIADLFPSGFARVFLIALTALVIGGLVVFSIFCLRARVRIDADGISISQFGRSRTVRWDDIQRYDYPISMGRGGFTPYGYFTRTDGSKEFFPCGGRKTAQAMIEILIQKDIAEKTANQALQTTSVTRSGFGKAPVSDRQRRGV